MIRPAVCVAALVLASAPARAADPCAGSTQMDIDACAAAAFQRADAAMNGAYATLMKQIGQGAGGFARGPDGVAAVP